MLVFLVFSDRRGSNVKRRQVLTLLGVSSVSSISGCGGNRVGADPRETLEFRYATVETTDRGWSLLARTHVPRTGRVPAVRIVAYSLSGELVGATRVGDLLVGGDHEVRCSAVPVVLTATTALSCEEIDVEMLYWTGPTEYDRIGPNDSRWEKTTRRCDETLPPERVLDEVRNASESDNG